MKRLASIFFAILVMIQFYPISKYSDDTTIPTLSGGEDGPIPIEGEDRGKLYYR